MKKYIFIVAFMLLHYPVFSQMWNKTQGNIWRATKVKSITAGVTNILYATDASGVIKSNDAGVSWSKTTQLNSPAFVIACEPNLPNMVHAGTVDKLSRSTDGGATWDTPNDQPIAGAALSLSISKSEQTTIFAGIRFNTGPTMLRSLDAGDNWSGVNFFSSTVKTDINAIAIHPTNPNIIYAGGSKPTGQTTGTLRGVFRSLDKGVNWFQLPGLSTSDEVRAVGFYDISGTRYLFTGMKNGALKYTTNDGANWTTIYSSTTAPWDSIYTITSDGSCVYLATNNALYKNSPPNHTTFSQCISGMYDWLVYCVAVDPQVSTTLFAGASSNIFKTTGNCAWSPINNGISYANLSSVSVQNGTILASSEGCANIWKSVNSGADWTSKGFVFSKMLQSFNAKQILLDQQYGFLTGNVGNTDAYLYYSLDGGENWLQKIKTGASSFYGTISDPVKPGHYFTFGDGLNTSNGNLFESYDYGASWSSKVVSTVSRIIYSMGVDPTGGDPNIYGAKYTYAAMEATSTSNGGVYKQTNWGGGFFNNQIGIGPKGHDMFSLAINGKYPLTLYAGGAPTSTYNQGMWVSLDSNATWTSIRSDTTIRIIIDPRFTHPSYQSKYVFAIAKGSSQKVYRSTNGGLNWIDVSAGLPSMLNDLRTAPQDTTVIYIAAGDGIYKAQLIANPSLDQPLNAAVLNYCSPSQTFSWSPPTNGGPPYHIQISTNSAFSTPLFYDSTGITQPTVTVTRQFPVGATYYWRVSASDGFGEGPWSQYRTFTTTMAAPGVVGLDQPPDAAVLNYCSPTQAFSWFAPSNGGPPYHIQISMNSTFTAPLFYELSGITQTSVIITQTFPTGSTYYWRIAASYCYGEGPWSQYRSFTTSVFAPGVAGLVFPTSGMLNTENPPLFKWHPFSYSSAYQIQISKDRIFATIDVDESGITDTSKRPFKLLKSAQKFYWRVRGFACDNPGSWSVIDSFTTNATEVSVVLRVTGDITLISVPVTRVDNNINTLWPRPPRSGPIYNYLSPVGWTVAPDNVWPGLGCWTTYYSGPTTITYTGTPIYNLWTDVMYVGDNTLGSISGPATIDSTDPPGIVSRLYDVRGNNLTVIPAGGGAWIRLSGNGRIHLTTAVPSKAGRTPELAEIQIPKSFKLEQNYPNPFNPSTIIKYQVPSVEYVSMKVYDVLGQVVASLVNEVKQPGEYSVQFDASASGGLPSGIYFYRLTAGKFTDIKKAILMK